MGFAEVRRTILIVDDDRTFCDSVKDYLSSEAEKMENLHACRSDKKNEENVLIGSWAGLAEVKRPADAAARADAPVLITGEQESARMWPLRFLSRE